MVNRAQIQIVLTGAQKKKREKPEKVKHESSPINLFSIGPRTFGTALFVELK